MTAKKSNDQRVPPQKILWCATKLFEEPLVSTRLVWYNTYYELLLKKQDNEKAIDNLCGCTLLWC